MPKSNLVIHDKKLPKSVAETNKNWQHSTEGKKRAKEAAELQHKIQGELNQAMAQKKVETGSTGMKDSEYNNLISQVTEKNSHRTAFGAAGKRLPATAKRFKQVFKDGKSQLVQIAGPVD